jgi:WD40 repeat protein
MPNILACSGADGVSVVDTETDALLCRSLEHEDAPCTSWLYDGSTLIIGKSSTTIACLDALAGYQLLDTLVGHTSPVLCLDFNQVSHVTVNRNLQLFVGDSLK